MATLNISLAIFSKTNTLRGVRKSWTRTRVAERGSRGFPGSRKKKVLFLVENRLITTELCMLRKTIRQQHMPFDVVYRDHRPTVKKKSMEKHGRRLLSARG